MTDQVLVRVPDDVESANAGGAEVEDWVGEVLKQVLEAAVPVLGLAEVGLAVEVDVPKYVLELGPVRVLDLFEADVDQLADVRRVTTLVQILEMRLRWHDEPLPAERPLHANLVALVPLLQFFLLVGPDVAHVLEEEHDQQVVLVLGRVQRTAKCVAGPPESVVDLLLRDTVRHGDPLVSR